MIKPAKHPPKNIAELHQRAEQIAGLSLGELADAAEVLVPDNFLKNKGWTGQLIELYLGAEAGSTPQQDFPELGVELKTIPIDRSGKPLETTYVCYAPLMDIAGIRWEQSNVRNKLNCVLWIPVEGERGIPPANRRIANPVLWQPNDQELTQLRADWEELMDLISLGQIDSVTARVGQVMQLRPKAADGTVVTDAVGLDGQKIKTRPRGFYLRKEFTANILANHFTD